MKIADRGLRIADCGSLLRVAASLPPHRARMVVQALAAKSSPSAPGPQSTALSEAAAAFESDMRPVVMAIVSALEAGDMEALKGLRAVLPHLLAEVNADPALADVMAFQLGKSLVDGLTAKGDAK